MRKHLPVLFLLLVLTYSGHSQITGPVIRAAFGVDGDLRSNYFNSLVQSGNDDWFSFPGSSGTGKFVIDTTGAAAIVARYNVDMAFRRSCFSRPMKYPQFTLLNNRLLMDAVFVRDFHGDDSTVFSGGNKNGDNPGAWTSPVSQGIPDKNDILDMMVHIRRAGPTNLDSLWMFGGMSLDNTTGNRYFDFEMYQTDFYYDRSVRKFFGYGPDAGHTSWEFDMTGNVTKAGDIIFSAEYQSASLTFVEARIWTNKANLALTPVSFVWSGQFDGASAGSTYGYASIQPKGAGVYYTGLQCGNNTWGGPFSIILQNETMATDYIQRQYVEFSVNLSKLGLDPATTLGGDVCGLPFKSILVKTRASSSFTAELKDFVAPFAFFDVPKANLQTATPAICDHGSVAEIHVVDSISSSLYQWSTANGHIITSPTGPSIQVDKPGTYYVMQTLVSGCAPYAFDTIVVTMASDCIPLPSSMHDFRGSLGAEGTSQLNWRVLNNQEVSYFEVERSLDGVHFTNIGRVERKVSSTTTANYSFEDNIANVIGANVYYRIRMINANQSTKYSNSIRLSLVKGNQTSVSIFPNPARDLVQVQISATGDTEASIQLFELSGKLVFTTNETIQRGNNIIALDKLAGTAKGVYLAVVHVGNEVFRQKIVLLQ
jgi:hypothetical protein